MLSGLLCLSALQGLWAMDVHSHTRGTRHRTTGFLDTAGWTAEARLALDDPAEWNHWVIRFMDGQDPVSREFWVWFVAVDSPDSQGICQIHYRLNMGLLFGTEERTMPFHFQRPEPGHWTLRLARQIPGADVVVLDLVLGADGRLVFNLDISFWPLVALLIDFQAFDRDMVWRVGRMQENLRDWCLPFPE